MHKLSLIKKDGRRQYMGIFATAEEAREFAEMVMEFDTTLASYEIKYTE